MATSTYAMAIMVLKVSSMKRPPNILNVCNPLIGLQAFMIPMNRLRLMASLCTRQIITWCSRSQR